MYTHWKGSHFEPKDMVKTWRFGSDDFPFQLGDTVDERNPAPPGMYKAL